MATSPEIRRGPIQESDRVPARRLLAIGAAILAATLGGLLWAFAWADASPPAARHEPPPALFAAPGEPQAGPHAAGIPARETLLEGYAWADREHTLVRIPIEEAMRIVAESP